MILFYYYFFRPNENSAMDSNPVFAQPIVGPYGIDLDIFNWRFFLS